MTASVDVSDRSIWHDTSDYAVTGSSRAPARA